MLVPDSTEDWHIQSHWHLKVSKHPPNYGKITSAACYNKRSHFCSQSGIIPTNIAQYRGLTHWYTRENLQHTHCLGLSIYNYML